MIFFWIIHIFSNFIFNGCIITKLEYYLTKENITVIDHLIFILGLDRNNIVRRNITIAGGIFLLLITILRIFK